MAIESLDTEEMIESSDDFARAYESYNQRIYRFLFWRTKDHELSQDLSSTVFEKAWRSRASFKGGSVLAWLYTIARNILTDYWRKKKDISVEDTDTLATPRDDTAEQLDTQMQIERLQLAVKKLSTEMRSVVELRFIEGKSAKQVGLELQLSEGNVRVIQYRALQQIRKQL